MTQSRFRTAAVTALVASAAAASLVACSGSGPSGADQGQPSALTIAIPNVSPPFTASSQANTALRITTNIFDPLVFLDPKTGKVSPGIAESWTRVSDTALDLKIRKNVIFQDGVPLTVDDVAFTLSAERLSGPKALEPTALASTFASVKATDDSTVRVTTKQADPSLLLRLASPIGLVVPKKLIETEGIKAFGLHPVGTGPYQVKSVSPGESVELVANDKYWGPKPTYKAITFRQVSEVSARVSGLATGEYNAVTNLPPDQVSVVKSNGQETKSVQVNNVVSLAFVTAKKSSPVADVRVRRAFALAIDRKGINRSFWGDSESVPDGFNLPVYQDFYNSSQQPTAQDVTQARTLLSEAGYSGKTILVRYVSGLYTNFDKALEAMLPMWKAVGLNVKLQGVADFTLLDYGTLDVYATSSNISFPDPVSPLWTDWLSPNSVYVSQGRGANSPELTSAGKALAETLAPEARKSAFATATKLWDEQLPALAIWQPIDIYGVGKGVDLKPDPRYWMRLAPTPQG